MSNGLLAFTWTRNLLADPAIQTIPQLATDLQNWQAGPAVLDTTSAGTTATTQTWLSTETGTPGARARAQARVLIVVP